MRSNRVRRIYNNPNSLDSESFNYNYNTDGGSNGGDFNARLSSLEQQLNQRDSSQIDPSIDCQTIGFNPTGCNDFDPCGPTQNQPCFPRRPPIIFDGYKLFYKCGIFYILPETQHTDFYRFIYLSTARKWAYQPIHPITLEPMDPNFDQPMYYYSFISGKGWSLIPNDPTYPQDPSPHTIVGYAYVYLGGYGYCYVPSAPCFPQYCPPDPCNPFPPTCPPCQPSPCPPPCPPNWQPGCPTPNPCPSVCMDKILVFDFNYYNPYINGAYYPYYYDASANGTSGNDPIYRYPFYIENANPINIVPFIAGGVGYILPFNNNQVEV